MGGKSSKKKKDSDINAIYQEFDAFKEKPRLYEFERFMCLGKGSFGNVDGCLYRDYPVAMKRIKKARLFRRTDHSALVWNERNAMIFAANEPFCVPALCAVQSIDDIYLIMPFYPGGDLKSLLKAKGRLPTTAVIFYLAEILVGLESLHSLNVCHRDMKPDNIFIDEDGHIAIGDFGLSITVCENLMHPSHYWGKCGSYAFRAPEVVLDLVCGRFSDIYSLGVSVYFLLYGGVPFRETKVRLSGKPLRFPDISVPAALVNLIEWMMELEPADRCTIEQIKVHPVFEGLDWEAVRNKEYEPHMLPDPTDFSQKLAEVKEFEMAEEEEPTPLNSEQQRRFLGFDWLPGQSILSQGESGDPSRSPANESYETPAVRTVGSARSPAPNSRGLKLRKSMDSPRVSTRQFSDRGQTSSMEDLSKFKPSGNDLL